MKLNLGGGSIEIDGWVNIDRKNGQEAYPLPHADNSVDEIRASHILEHFCYADTQAVLNEWCRVLKPGGRIRVAVPDAEKVARAVLGEADLSGLDPITVLHGGQMDENDVHRTSFNAEGLAFQLRRAGFACVQRWQDEIRDCSLYPFSLNLEAFKLPDLRECVKGLKVQAVLSTGRISYSLTQANVATACQELGIGCVRVMSAYYEKTLERTFEGLIADGAEWALCIDGDSVFTVEDVARLCLLAKEHPEAGAFIPIQSKRGGKGILVSVDGEGSALEMRVSDIVPATQGHFGLTLVNLTKLKAMAKPWFHHQPSPEGKWDSGAVDADVAFWRKLTALGVPIYCANRITIGHIEEVVSWPNERFETFYQQYDEWASNGKPAGTRT